jgi:hypothetical protein
MTAILVPMVTLEQMALKAHLGPSALREQTVSMEHSALMEPLGLWVSTEQLVPMATTGPMGESEKMAMTVPLEQSVSKARWGKLAMKEHSVLSVTMVHSGTSVQLVH